MHYLYDNTFEGLLTCYYHHLKEIPCSGIYIRETYQMSLLNAFKEIKTDQAQGDRMYDIIRQKLSREALTNVFYCFLSDHYQKEKQVFDYLNLGFQIGRDFTGYHTHKAVLPLLQTVRKVKYECQRYLGYVRFTSLGDILYSSIHPSFNILPVIADHFADRFRSEVFVIHDENRNIALLSKNGQWYIAPFNKKVLANVKEYDLYEHLWKTYFHTVGIESRKNIKLQQSFVPLKYQKDLLEFQ